MPATSGAYRASVGGGWPISRTLLTEPPPAAAKRRRPGADHVRRAAVALSALLLVFSGAALLSGFVPFSLSLRPSWDAGFEDAEEFGRLRIGEILFADGRGNACRKIQFHNDNGRFGPDLKVRCDTGLAEDYTATVRRMGPNAGRLLSIRDAFLKR